MIFPSHLTVYPGHLANSVLARFVLPLCVDLLLAILAIISVGRVAADCPKAEDWARTFYTEHYEFYAGEPDPILKFTTPEFGAVLKGMGVCEGRGRAYGLRS